jgi:hypothetical protein
MDRDAINTSEDERMVTEIIVIDEERYLIPSIFQDGKLVPAPDRKIKLPITITRGFHINRRSRPLPKESILERLLSLITK